MKRRNRELALFNLSALDVLAMATGTFVLIVVLLLPYYRKTFEANAAIEQVRVSSETQTAEAEGLRKAAADDEVAAAAARAAVAALQAEAEETRAAAAGLLADAKKAQRKARLSEWEAKTREQHLDKKVVEALDLIFVIDTTASMSPVLEELALSMGGIVRVLERLVPSLRVGFVAYRDNDFGTWVTRKLPATSTASQAKVVYDYVNNLRAAPRGGPTPDEAVFDGLRVALALPHRQGAKVSMILIGDARAHPHEEQATLTLAQRFAASGPRRTVSALFVSTPSQRRFGRGDRAFFQRLAQAGGGAFKDHGGEMIESILLSVLD